MQFNEKLVSPTELIKVELLPWKIWKADVSNISHSSEEGLMLETSAFQIFHGGNSTFINITSFTKPK